jgi:hypothetical protein
MIIALSRIRSVWVPAFAGTTEERAIEVGR